MALDNETNNDELAQLSDTPQPVEDEVIPSIDVVEDKPPVVVKPKGHVSGVIDDINLYNKTYEAVEKEYDQLENKLSALRGSERKAFEAVLADPTTYEHRLVNAWSNMRSSETKSRMFTEMIEDQAALGHTLVKAVDRLSHSIRTMPSANKEQPAKPAVLSGHAGKVEAISRLHGFCRIPLFNSGFWITIRPESLLDLNSFFESVDDEEKTYGRLLGGHYYYTYDYTLKQTFIDNLIPYIVDSSLKDWDDSKRLEKALRIHDYDVVAGGVCYMIFKRGIRLNLPCLNEGCDHEELLDVDLSDIRYNFRGLLPDECIDTVLNAQSKSQTLEDLEAYQAMLPFNNVIDNIDEDGTRIICEVPTMYRHLESGGKINARIVSSLGSNSIVDKRFLTQANSLRPYEFIPWIKSIEIGVGTPNWSIATDKDVILTLVDELLCENKPILKKIDNQFVKRTKLTIMGYPGVQCTKCGLVPEGPRANIYPADTQQLFFYLCMNVLLNTGAE